MTSFTVTTLDDETFDGGDFESEAADGDGLSLREAIALANATAGADDITFAAELAKATITLTSGELVLSSDVTIDGDVSGDGGVPEITIDADGGSRVIKVTGGSSILEGVVITGGKSDANGGGLYVASGATVALTDSTVAGNETSERGGGIWNKGTVTLVDTTVSDNVSDRSGGGIQNRGDLTLVYTTVSDNQARNGGGIWTSGSATLIDTTLLGNSAANGGGMQNVGTATLVNTTVVDNAAITGGLGGGVKNDGDLILTNSTVSGNTTSWKGGGIENDGTATLTNTIVLGNTTSWGRSEVSGEIIENGPNIIGGAAADVFAAIIDNGGVDAGQLADNGGAVWTIALKNDASNPALDAGDDAASIGVTLDEAALGVDLNGDGDQADILDDISDFAFDARGDGFRRAVDLAQLSDNDVDQIDLGAFELQRLLTDDPQTLVVTTLDDELDFEGPDAFIEVMGGPDDLSLREALFIANQNLASADTIVFAAGLVGGRVRLSQGALTLTSDVTISGDVSGDGGAPEITIDANGASSVFSALGGSSALEGLVITGGSDAGPTEGGVFVATAAAVAVTHSSISGNATVGISNAGTLTLIDSAVSGNRGGDDCGGIYNSGTATLINTSVSGNRGGYGGGIGNSGTATLINTSVSGNHSASGGGIYNGGTVTLIGATVSGNYAIRGGGIVNEGTATVVNSTVSGNRSAESSGGGISNTGTALVTNTTISGNSSYSSGAGISNQGSVTLTNSIVLGNFVPGAGASEISGGFTSGGANIVGGPGAPSIFAEIVRIDDDDVNTGRLADNGGAVKTIALRLNPDNPALDAGDDTAPLGVTLDETALGVDVNSDGDITDIIDDISDFLFDARGGGFDRVADQTNIPGGGLDGIDLGAFEVQQILPPSTPEAPSLVVTTTADVADRYDGETSLRDALALANDPSAGSQGDGDADNDGNANDTITFAADLSGATITLTTGQLNVGSNITIAGDISGDGGAPEITIDANGASRVFKIDDGSSTLDSLVITGGRVFGRDGGGIAVADGASVIVVDSEISNNIAFGDGGGISNAGGSATLVRTTVVDNGAWLASRLAGGLGGGVDGPVTLIDSTVSGNSARAGGGIGGGATLINTTVSGNSAYLLGGGISGGATLINTTVSGNTAEFGGGIFGPATLTNSIVLGNRGGEVDEPVTQNGPNIIGGGASAEVFAQIVELHNTDAGLLDDNGGAVWTIALKNGPTNPALDAGDDTASLGVVLDEAALGVDINGDGDTDDLLDDISDFLSDARGSGFDRFVDQSGITANDPNQIDLGAFELQVQNTDPGPTPSTPGDDSLRGTAFGDTIGGMGGDDTIDGLEGDDVLKGDGGAEVGAGCVRVRFVSEAAANQNTYGWYDTKTLEAGILVANTDTTANPGVQDFIATLSVAPDDIDTLGFFLIPNGFRRNDDPGQPFADGDGTDLDLRVINSGGIWKLRDMDSGHVFDGTGNPAYFTEAGKNPDGLDHVLDQGDLASDRAVTHSWEDLPGLGDGDFNDVVFDVSLGCGTEVAGDDVLTGGAGDDTLSGGPGADTFRYQGTGFGRDRITDFALGIDAIAFEDVGSASQADDLTYTVGNFGGDDGPQDIRITFAGLGADLADAWIDVFGVGSDVDALKADLVFV